MHIAERMRLFRALALVAGAFLLLVQAAGAHGLNPSTVVDSYERAWGQNDVDAALGHLADNAVITVQDARTRSLTGRDQIREFLQSAALRAAPVLTSSRQADGAKVMWSERLEGQVLNAKEVSVQALVKDGKIQSLVYRPGRMVGPQVAEAPTGTTESASMALGAVLLLSLGLLSLATVRTRVRTSSNLHGSLHRDLRHWRRRRSQTSDIRIQTVVAVQPIRAALPEV
jgi:hypothetical protein